MIKANEFNEVRYRFLSDEECMEIKNTIGKICNNHSNDEWWKVYVSINAMVSYYLNNVHTDDAFNESYELEMRNQQEV